ncbi:MAG: UDP-N-acetylmuramoyl-tripeptide--D-alanyl-D-alanine ligase, partial [Clostridiales bacterium]|nr:UDP-N-acetylmuramoyl-tripeptide--D-alanyl-D-alanine ligase [Clostridiales bacterium]
MKRMEGITLKQIAKWCGGTVEPAFEEVRVKGFTKDSRQLTPGNLYVAIQGARVDGHDFVKQVLEQGAAAVLVEKRQAPDVPAVLVKDTERALGSIASGYRATLHAKVLAITGSVGKTTTKEMLAAIMEKSHITGKTPQNYNNRLGLPLSLLNMEPDCEVAVLEMGM